jgi:hypothetical protein
MASNQKEAKRELQRQLEDLSQRQDDNASKIKSILEALTFAQTSLNMINGIENQLSQHVKGTSFGFYQVKFGDLPVFQMKNYLEC